MTVLDRRAARVVLVDRADRTLLMRGGDPARPGLRWWFTPGGGLEPGETPAEGGARELFEETGLRVTPAALGEPVWHQVTEFSYDGRTYRQDQDFFLVRVDEWVVDTAGFDPAERATIDAHRWWSADEIAASEELIYPAELADLLRRLVGPTGPSSAVPAPAPTAPAPTAPAPTAPAPTAPAPTAPAPTAPASSVPAPTAPASSVPAPAPSVAGASPSAPAPSSAGASPSEPSPAAPPSGGAA